MCVCVCVYDGQVDVGGCAGGWVVILLTSQVRYVSLQGLKIMPRMFRADSEQCIALALILVTLGRKQDEYITAVLSHVSPVIIESYLIGNKSCKTYYRI